MTYADEDAIGQQSFFSWAADSDNDIEVFLDTQSATTGNVRFRQESSGVGHQVQLINGYSPGINVPFNIASRHTSSDINGAVDGTALTADTTPTALPDLSATDFEIAPTGVINIKTIRILGGYGATDAELEAATVS